jgi:hypothetical protein
MNILMRKTSDKTQDSGIRSMGLFYILCLVFLNNVIIETDDDDVIIETRELIYIDDSDAEEEQAMDSDDPAPRERGFDQDRRNREDGARQPRQREGGRQRPGGRLPPAVREMMEEENISPEDLRDPDIRKKVFEKARRMRMEAEEGSPPDEKQKKSENESEKKGLEGYMAVIDKKNLFLPLGSGGEQKKSAFALTAVLSGSEDRAIIEEMGGGRSFYVAKGETFADEIEVVDIGEQVVKLDRSGEEEELRLGEGTSSGRRGGGKSSRRGGRSSGGGKPSKGGSDQGGGSDFDADKIPPFARRMLERHGISIEDLKNNPELQKKLRTEFEKRFGGGGGDRRPQPVMIQGGRAGGRQRGGNRRPRR